MVSREFDWVQIVDSVAGKTGWIYWFPWDQALRMPRQPNLGRNVSKSLMKQRGRRRWCQGLAPRQRSTGDGSDIMVGADQT